ncbi:MAG TPA: hypothetical protein VMJ10_25770 [Kofleriaceae bacterium]|nr:hypothetical protein [Kofleriaceae bacterium]
MRACVVTLVVAACGRDAAPVVTTDPASEAVTPPAPAAKAHVATTVSAKVGPIGPLVEPPPPTPAAVARRACGDATPIELGATDGTEIGAAFGRDGHGIAAWSPSKTRLAVRRLDGSGKPTGPVSELEVPAPVTGRWIRALDHRFIVLLSTTDFSGPPVLKLYAVVVDADGKPDPTVLQIAIGDRGMIDDVSPGGERGVSIWAGPTPATQIRDGRLVTLVVDAQGKLAQSIVDVPDPAPGDRARALFSLGDHAVALIGDTLMFVDDKPLAQKRSGDAEGLWLAPTFHGPTIPALALSLGKKPATMQVGTVALDGTVRFDQQKLPRTGTLPAGYEDRVSWGTSSGGGEATTVWSSRDLAADAPTERVALPAAFSSSGLGPEVVWSGEQVLVLAADRHHAQIMPLPCTRR